MGQGPGRGAANEDVFSSIIAMDPRMGDRRWTFRLSAPSTESGVLTTQSNMFVSQTHSPVEVLDPTRVLN